MPSNDQSIEIQGKSLEEAKAAAAKSLGVDPSELQVTVLEETKGLFGKGSVRIRASVSASPPAEEKPKGRAKAAAKGGAKAKKAAEPEAEKPAEIEAPVSEEPTEAEEGEDSGNGFADAVATEEDAQKLASIVQEILKLASLEATVKPTGMNGRYVNLELDGKDVAYLVGKHGEVLNAFQYLLNVIGVRQMGNGVRATLDGNNYRRRREEALQGLAEKIAVQVRERGEEAVLDALPAFERRVVHKALQGFGGVRTYSEGEEPNRRVVIAPED